MVLCYGCARQEPRYRKDCQLRRCGKFRVCRTILSVSKSEAEIFFLFFFFLSGEGDAEEVDAGTMDLHESKVVLIPVLRTSVVWSHWSGLWTVARRGDAYLLACLQVWRIDYTRYRSSYPSNYGILRNTTQALF